MPKKEGEKLTEKKIPSAEWSTATKSEELIAQTGGSVDVDIWLDNPPDEMILLKEAPIQRKGDFGEYLSVYGEMEDGQTIGFNTGSAVLIQQFTQLAGKYPVIVKIAKVTGKSGRAYYTMGS